MQIKTVQGRAYCEDNVAIGEIAMILYNLKKKKGTNLEVTTVLSLGQLMTSHSVY